MKVLTAAILLALTTAAHAGPWHCQRPDGSEYVCHMCMRGHWPTGEEYPCTAAQERRQMRDFELKACSQIELTKVPNGKFKDHCLDISRKSP